MVCQRFFKNSVHYYNKINSGFWKLYETSRCLNFENQGKIVKAIDSVNLLNVGTLAAVTFLYYCAL